MRPRTLALAALLAAAALPAPALAWGYEGHEIIAAIARARLTVAGRARVDAILVTDADTLTGPDMIARATWADAWRSAGHRETASWHFVDLELDSPNLDAACFGRLAPASPPSAGPAQDCVVDKLDAFTAELAAPGTAPAERLLALKYVLHFVGDVHQPLGSDSRAAATRLSARITPAQAAAWAHGTAGDWALESFGVAKAVAYTLKTPAGCGADAAPVALPDAYVAQAQAAADLQLEKAGVRLAWVLNTALRGGPPLG